MPTIGKVSKAREAGVPCKEAALNTTFYRILETFSSSPALTLVLMDGSIETLKSFCFEELERVWPLQGEIFRSILTIALSLFSLAPAAFAEEPISRFVRQTAGATTVIVFVHGFHGNGILT